MKAFLIAAVLSIPALPLAASDDCTEDAMIVFDGSGSMSEMGFNDLAEPRIFDARRALHRAVPPIAKLRRLGLSIYGPGENANRCANITRHFAPMADAAGPLLATVDALEPAGPTPLTAAVAQAAETLDYRNRPATIVLVTDGKETCSGATCQLAAHLAHDGADLTVHVIGFRVRPEHFDWNAGLDMGTDTAAACLAEATGGKYIAAESIDDLVSAMSVTLGCPVYGALE
ncbi:vWA domain-containing protein [Palleronia pontilimi]|nr:VWA domain-containing protein [Palleronia pontilimi]